MNRNGCKLKWMSDFIICFCGGKLPSLTGEHVWVIYQTDQERSTTWKKNLQDKILKFKAGASTVVYIKNNLVYYNIWSPYIFLNNNMTNHRTKNFLPLLQLNPPTTSVIISLNTLHKSKIESTLCSLTIQIWKRKLPFFPPFSLKLSRYISFK